MIVARAGFIGKIAAVFIAITDEGHRPVAQRGQKKWAWSVIEPALSFRPVFFHHDKVGVDMHLARGTFGGNVLHFARAITVEYFAVENTLNDFTLRLIKFFRRRKNALDTADSFRLVIEKSGKTCNGRGIPKNHSRTHPTETLHPVSHFRLS